MSSPPEQTQVSEEQTAYDNPDPCPETPEVEAPEGAPTTTVMIYLAGDNNLTEECLYALTELKKALPPEGTVRVFAQYDPGDEFLPTQRYWIRFNPPGCDTGSASETYPVARDLIDQFPFRYESRKAFYIRAPFGERKERTGEGHTGDPKMLYNFVAYCVDQYPKTDHYVLIVCGHGAGVYRDFLMRDNRPDGYLTIFELRQALRWMHERLRDKHHRPLKLDLFGMDVCLMSMAEITYELRDYVTLAIGCESYSPAAGWPYRQTINQIHLLATSVAKAAKAGQQVPFDWELIAKDIVTEYVRFYSDYWLAGLSVTMSAIRVDKVRELRRLLSYLSDLMIHELREEAYKQETDEEETETDEDPHDSHDPRRYHRFSDALVLAHWRAQSYNGELYVDLVDFCNCLIPYATPHIRQACRGLINFITDEDHGLIIKSCSWGRNYQYSYGISIYFPWDTLMPYYGASIGFPAKSRWVDFLREYIAKTRRAPREHPHPVTGDDLEVIEKIRKQNLSETRMGSDKMGSDKMGSDKGGNPIHSMRNPPIVFIPDPCIDDPCMRWHNNRAQARLMRDVEDQYDKYDHTYDEEDRDNPRVVDREAGDDVEGP